MFLTGEDLRKAICYHLGCWNPFNIDSTSANFLPQPVSLNIDVWKLRIDSSVFGDQQSDSLLIITSRGDRMIRFE